MRDAVRPMKRNAPIAKKRVRSTTGTRATNRYERISLVRMRQRNRVESQRSRSHTATSA
jgi:hypothetical protein